MAADGSISTFVTDLKDKVDTNTDGLKDDISKLGDNPSIGDSMTLQLRMICFSAMAEASANVLKDFGDAVKNSVQKI